MFFLAIVIVFLFYSLFKLEQPILLVKLLWHVRVWMMLIEEFNGMES